MYSFKLVETKAEKMRAVGQNDRIARYMSVCTSKRFRKDLGLVDIKDNVLLHYNFDTDEKRVIKGKLRSSGMASVTEFFKFPIFRRIDVFGNP